jgi:hypothetical protein
MIRRRGMGPRGVADAGEGVRSQDLNLGFDFSEERRWCVPRNRRSAIAAAMLGIAGTAGD